MHSNGVYDTMESQKKGLTSSVERSGGGQRKLSRHLCALCDVEEWLQGRKGVRGSGFWDPTSGSSLVIQSGLSPK